MKSENESFCWFLLFSRDRKAKGENDEKCFLFHQQNFLKIFNFLSWLFFGHVAKRLGQEDVIFKIYDVMFLEN